MGELVTEQIKKFSVHSCHTSFFFNLHRGEESGVNKKWKRKATFTFTDASNLLSLQAAHSSWFLSCYSLRGRSEGHVRSPQWPDLWVPVLELREPCQGMRRVGAPLSYGLNCYNVQCVHRVCNHFHFVRLLSSHDFKTDDGVDLVTRRLRQTPKWLLFCVVSSPVCRYLVKWPKAYKTFNVR